MITDLVLDPFGASVDEIMAAAAIADASESGYSGIWTYDHITAMAWPGAWSRDPFTIFGAVAAQTKRITVGPLVANVYHRHPVQLALAVNTLQAISDGRAMCGLGSGAAPGSRFAIDYDALGIELDADAADRRTRLITTIETLRKIRVGDRLKVVDDSPPAPIIVGASGAHSVRLAARYADGVNIRIGEHFEQLAEIAISTAVQPNFEVSAFTGFDIDHPLGGDMDRAAQAGATRRTLAVRSPYPLAALEQVAINLDRVTAGASGAALK